MKKKINIFLSGVLIALSIAQSSAMPSISSTPPAFSSHDESMDDPDVVRAANYWKKVVRETFGVRGLARIEIASRQDSKNNQVVRDRRRVVTKKWASNRLNRIENDAIFFSAWGIDHGQNVWGWDGFTWHYLTNRGRDIGAGGGIAILVKTDRTMWVWNGYEFEKSKTREADGGFVRAEVGSDGVPIMITYEGDALIWNFRASRWDLLLRRSQNVHIDLDIGSDRLFITRKNGTVWTFNGRAGRWNRVNWARRSLATRRIEK